MTLTDRFNAAVKALPNQSTAMQAFTANVSSYSAAMELSEEEFKTRFTAEKARWDALSDEERAMLNQIAADLRKSA